MNPDPATSILIGLAAGTPISIISARKGLIQPKAAALAALLAPLYLLASPGVFAAALTFFATSSLLTRHGYTKKKLLGAAEPPAGRTWTQVLGAGGVAAAAALLPPLGLLTPRKAALAALAAIAASTADTWAAEIGSLYGGTPRLAAKPWIRVPPGVSGGVTLTGELASAAGSATIALTALALSSIGALPTTPSDAATIALAGYLGEIVDSLIGSTLQPKYLCPRCHVLTDKKTHTCGTPTTLVAGVPILTNEATNLASTLAAALTALLLS